MQSKGLFFYEYTISSAYVLVDDVICKFNIKKS